MNIKTFPQGGVHPHDHKLSAYSPVKKLDIPETVSIPIAQHIGAPAEPVVNVTDKVKVGQLIAKATGFISSNIHSSVSGTVLKIDDIVDTSGYKKKVIVIKVEGDAWDESIDKNPKLNTQITATSEQIVEKIKDAGIVGLGGATFPSFVKLMVPEGKTAEFLVINGAECEPFLTSDHRLLLEKTRRISYWCSNCFKKLLTLKKH